VTQRKDREATRLIRAGKAPDALPRTVGPPIQRGSTVLLPNAAALYDESQPTYGRAGLAAQATLASALCELERASYVELFPSGLAAVTAGILSVVGSGDDILVTDAIYRPTRRFCDHVLARFGIATRYYPPDAAPEALVALAGPKTRLIVLESPGSLTFEMQDVAAITRLARARNVLTLIDNTWGAGLLFKPLDHGVDLSTQALTKYVGGHSDVFMGSVAVKTPALEMAVHRTLIDFGWAVNAEDSYLMLRGLRTLATRLERCGASSLKVAAWLAEQPEVTQVLHPALPGAPGHALWRRDYSGAAGLFSLVLKPAPSSAVEAFLDGLEHFGLGFSWGGFESLAIHCESQFAVRTLKPTFAGPVIRLNIGLEDPDDLIADLRRGLDRLASG
jgi:cystathionine beta-lyase